VSVPPPFFSILRENMQIVARCLNKLFLSVFCASWRNSVENMLWLASCLKLCMLNLKWHIKATFDWWRLWNYDSWNMIDHWYRLLPYYIFLSANFNDSSLILCLLWRRSRTAWIWSKKTAKLCKGKDPSNFRKRCACWHD